MIDAATLKALLPPSEHGSPLLEALLDAIGREVALADADIAQLYDDLFVETAADWAVPYLGALIGYRPLSGLSAAIAAPRAEVAQWVALSRSKGTVRAVERLARSTTGWHARVTEAAPQLARTQHLNLPTPEAPGTVSLRHLPAEIEAPAFLQAPRTIDTRLAGAGRWNLPNLLVDLFPHSAVLLREAAPQAEAPGHFRFDPLGSDLPLHAPAGQAPEGRVSAVEHIAAPLTMQRLAALLAAGQTPPFAIRVDDIPLAPHQLIACDLEDWRDTLPGTGLRAGVDPARGRFVLVDADPAAVVIVDHWHAAATEVDGSPFVLGAGGWARPDPAGEDLATLPASRAGEDLATLPASPLQLAAGQMRDIRLTRSLLATTPLRIELAAGAALTLRGAAGVRWALAASLEVVLQDGATLAIRDLLAGDAITIDGAGTIRLDACTLASDLRWIAGAGGRLEIARSATGTLGIGPLVDLTAQDSVVDGDVGAGGDGGGALRLERVTVTGSVRMRMAAEVSNSIVAGALVLRRTQVGCLRYTYVGPGSQAPGGFRRQPDTAIAEAVAAARAVNPAITQAALDAVVAAAGLAAQPDFAAAPAHGHPDHVRLAARSGAAVRFGGEGGGEMGVWAALGAPFRRANLAERLKEGTPVALAAAQFEGGDIR